MVGYHVLVIIFKTSFPYGTKLLIITTKTLFITCIKLSNHEIQQINMQNLN